VGAETTPSRLVDAVEQARDAAVAEAADDMGAAAAADAVGEQLEVRTEDDGAVTHFFAARHCVDDDSPVTVSEVVLLPGPDAVVSPVWVPWHERVRPGDLGVGDLLPTQPDDARLAPAYIASDDPAVEELAREVGLGRKSVLSREGRDAATERWQGGEHGPHTDMARSAPAHCGTCGFLLPLAGALSGAFGVCANAYSPADGEVVAMEFGCGAHSDMAYEPVSPVAVAELVYDDGVELERAGVLT
jgi:hypothetical protein